MFEFLGFFIAVSPCGLILMAMIPPAKIAAIPRWRWRRFCGEFLFLAFAFLACAFWSFCLNAWWQLTAIAFLFTVVSAACCVLSAFALAVTKFSASQLAESRAWEGAKGSHCGADQPSTLDPL